MKIDRGIAHRLRHAERGQQRERPVGSVDATRRRHARQRPAPRPRELARAERQEERNAQVGQQCDRHHPGERGRRLPALLADAGDHHVEQQPHENEGAVLEG